MVNKELFDIAVEKFKGHFATDHKVAAYAPGRVEVLGNHTDYNEGYVLSAAINLGTFFIAAPSGDAICRIYAPDVEEETSFDIKTIAPSSQQRWSNYVKGVISGLSKLGKIKNGFNGVLLSNIPLGVGLSSSAALEISSGLALAELYGIKVKKLDLAKIGQAAEHQYAGVKCGLLDQISSLFGRENELVMTDFRSLKVENVPLGKNACFLMCNTAVKHALLDGEYNERRAKCEEATKLFTSMLSHPVSTLRDVSWQEWEKYSQKMDPLTARRAAHPIGEDERVLKGRELLAKGNLEEFGKLMFESHKSSQKYFENSCLELDTIVGEAENIPGIMGARLTGGGFGGSVVVLIHPRDVEIATKAISEAYKKRHNHTCDIRVIKPSSGASVIK